jgi:(2Fe-2S) ferredoxin
MAEPLTRTPKPRKPLGVITPYEKPDLTVCGGYDPEKPCGVKALYSRFIKEADRLQIPLRMEPAKIGCSGACARGPFVSLPRLGLFYQQVQEDHVPFILQETVLKGKILFPLLRLDPLQSIRGDLIWEKETECLMTLDPSYCMVQIAHYFIRFHAEESCGKCVPCRLGIKRLGEVIESISRGQGLPEALTEIRTLISLMTQAAYCQFAGKASKIILAIIGYFREEFEIHIRDHYCPAGICSMV